MATAIQVLKVSEQTNAPVPVEWLFGIPVSKLDVAEAAAYMAARPADAPFAFVATPNASTLVALTNGNPGYWEPYKRTWLRLFDSRVVRIVARLLYGKTMPIAAGSDVTAYLFHHVITPDDRISVIGSHKALEDELRRQFGLKHLAFHQPPMGFVHNEKAMQDCIDFVVANPARFLFLAVGAPQSEILCVRLLDDGRAKGIGLCIGGSLLFVTGMKKRAPKIFLDLSLEWFYRLVTTPSTHIRRVFVDSLPILGLALRVWWHKIPHGPEGTAP
ncbi:MAG TPA: WecB/TagA/CpsF family glycosyltransferase [Magnetospirillaceae bacterium]|jgi:exopolysaccharide biosynthesis WecB/TagA/CpsF family protein